MSDLVKFVGVPALYEEEGRALEIATSGTLGAVRERVEGLTAVPGDRRLFAPAVVTSHRKLLAAATAMSRLSLTREEGTASGRMDLTCLRLSFDGAETILVEGANRAEHGVAKVRAKCRQQSSGWSVLVPAETLVRVIVALPDQPLEVAPGERLFVGNLSVQVTGGRFPDRPSPDLKEVEFQVVASRVGLASAVKFCSQVIDPLGGNNMQHLVLDPGRKMAGSTDRKRGRLMRLDLRSRARLQHPVALNLPLAAARAAIILESGDHVLMTVGDGMVVGADNYYVLVNKNVQSGVPSELFNFWPDGIANIVVLKKKYLVDFCQKAISMLRDKDAVISVYFGETIFRARATLRDEDVEREDLDWEIPIIMTKQSAIVDRLLFFRPEWLLEAVSVSDGEDVSIVLQRNATKNDHVTIYGEDVTKVSVVMPIKSKEDKYDDDY
jgi:hypothetical protein